MKKQLIFLLMSVTLMWSCSSEVLEMEPANETAAAEQTQTRTVEEALEIADAFFASISEPTRSGGRTLESVTEHKASLTRSGESSEAPALYIVNYKDNAGFAILGVSRNAADIYAISESGHFEVSDTTDNPGLADFFLRAETDASVSTLGLADSFGPVYPVSYQYVVTEKVEPMLHENVQKWHQGWPYNKYCNKGTSNKNEAIYPVGCGPISLGQILTYYEANAPYAYTYVGSDFKLAMDWGFIAEVALEEEDPEGEYRMGDLSKYLKILGNERFLKATYAPGITTCDSKYFRPSMVELNYYDEEKYHDFPLTGNFLEVQKFLKSGSGSFKAAPLIFAGTNANTNGIHFWVVDGYVVRVRKDLYPNTTSGETLFHCVWGQQPTSGFQNGYFLYRRDQNEVDSKAQAPEGGILSDSNTKYKSIVVCGGYRRKPYF